MAAKYRRASSPLYAGESIQLCMVMSCERWHCKASSPAPAHVEITTAGSRGTAWNQAKVVGLCTCADTDTWLTFLIQKRGQRAFRSQKKKKTQTPEHWLGTPTFRLFYKSCLSVSDKGWAEDNPPVSGEAPGDCSCLFLVHMPRARFPTIRAPTPSSAHQAIPCTAL